MFAAAGVSHSIFIDNMGAAFTCGRGKGVLGHGDTRIRTVPTKVQSLEVSMPSYCVTITGLKFTVSTLYVLQGVKVIRAAASVSKSIFISSDGIGYWCGEGMGELKNVRISMILTLYWLASLYQAHSA